MGLCKCFIFLFFTFFFFKGIVRFQYFLCKYLISNSIIAIKLFLVMILNMHLTSEILSQNDLKVSLILWWLCFNGDIRCPLSKSWFDLGSFLNGLSGRIKQHPFYPVKNSSIHSDSFRCIPLYMIMSFAHPTPLFRGRAKVIRLANNHYTVKCETYYFWKCIWITNNGY